MSGLREDQREAELLVTLIFASLPPEPRWCNREQAHSHTVHEHKSPVGASLLAMRPG
ncbi:hypothetical protein PS718_00942 [Pseudomonas fluorescens]|uniref:Uncharacterized protein n=1 Tax=Pseudomonas fluorescens TaxID=294 RepID=A0A5E7AM36_PSEFL|nr:hypothetical protein PS718_00942 [Pseudomonas fluorescens]